MNLSGSNRLRVALIAVLVVALAYVAVWRPRAGQVAELDAERDQLSQDLAGFTAVEAAPAPATVRSDRVDAAIPPTDGLADLLRQFESIAADTGVVQTAVTAQQPAAMAGVAGSSIPLAITVSGPRPAALEYVRRLGALPRLLVVDSVDLAPATEAADPSAGADAAPADRVQLEISGRVFTTALPATEATNG